MVFAATEFPLPMRKKQEALRFGVRGETYAYWHLRRLGYIFITRNYAQSRAKEEGRIALPELSITPGKHRVLVRTAHYFLRERHIKECPPRFDVVPSTTPQANRRLCGCTKRRLARKPDKTNLRQYPDKEVRVQYWVYTTRRCGVV
jgi:Holliday junction resolvase-like predicted endonuclease